MRKIESYWIDDVPTLKDIEEAFQIVKDNPNIIVEIKWAVQWSGHYSRSIDWDVVSSISPTNYLEDRIPHVYGM